MVRGPFYSGRGFARRPTTGLVPVWAMAAQAVPGAITATSQAISGHWSKTGRGAEAAGKAQLQQAYANQTFAEAELIKAKAYASGGGGGGMLDTTTLLILGGGALAAAFILFRRKK
jgi:hypothetical protein